MKEEMCGRRRGRSLSEVRLGSKRTAMDDDEAERKNNSQIRDGEDEGVSHHYFFLREDLWEEAAASERPYSC